MTVMPVRSSGLSLVALNLRFEFRKLLATPLGHKGGFIKSKYPGIVSATMSLVRPVTSSEDKEVAIVDLGPWPDEFGNEAG